MYSLALIGDIVDSRGVEERGALQRSLNALFDDLNRRFADSLLSPLTLTLGDEFQALFARADDLWTVITCLQAAVHPVQVRFGLGLGDIVTDINPQAALGMDGPAFHLARDAVEALKDEGGLLRVAGLEDGDLINPTLLLLSDAQTRWRGTRFRVFRDYLGDRPVEEIAKDLDISKVAVYKNINDGMLATIAHVLRAITARMNGALQQAHGH
ncbi:SatD family protein [Parahaliea mediterranea]|uniref:SatD family (SatD) n=1 Tax=Parahaliea mediterranea TaxID=651086 RepID=A0A939IJD8_9GAMM|nr:SatD family protein [Parahaliea mediterranea]MBN7797549.1 hypothetical protein [Parahaliea mediterranea]